MDKHNLFALRCVALRCVALRCVEHFFDPYVCVSSNNYCFSEISLKEIEKASFKFSGIER